MKILNYFLWFLSALSMNIVHAESLRCDGDIVEINDSKAEIIIKCGEPVYKDLYCEKTVLKIRQPNGTNAFVDHCDYIDVWTYNPGKGQFWTNLYFSEGKLRKMRYGDRIQ